MCHRLSLRPATSNDVPALLEIMLEAFSAGPDELYEYNFPHRARFMGDHELYWRFRIRGALNDPHSLVLIAEIEPNDLQNPSTTNTESVKPAVRKSPVPVGWVMWQVNSAPGYEIVSPEGWKIGDTWGKFFGRCLLFLYGSILATRGLLSHGRRDVDLAHYRQFFIQGDENDKKYWSLNGDYPHNLMLAGLGVKPKYQKRGFGSQMVQWGLYVAESQNEILCVGLECLKKEVAFYERLGFQTKGDSIIQVPGDDQKVELVVMTRHVQHG